MENSESECHKGSMPIHNQSTYCNEHNTCMFCHCGCYKESTAYKELMELRGGKLAGALY